MTGLPLRFHSAAAAEVADAVLYYELRRQGLGADFLKEVRAAAQRIQNSPTAFTPATEWSTGTQPVVKRIRLKRFPFRVVFVQLEDALFIIALAHQHRRPGYWQLRFPH